VVVPDSLEPPMTMTSEPVFAPARLAHRSNRAN
jgi:hypothetical protein